MSWGRIAVLFVIALLAAGCGGDDEAAPTETETTTAPTETVAVRVYFLREGKVWPVRRDVPEAGSLNAALAELLEGPTEQERADLGLATAIPESLESAEVQLIADAAAQIELSSDVPEDALGQIVYTATQYEQKAYEVDGRVLGRANFEDLTPAILVESPLAFEEVANPLRVTGTANTFEATFHYDLTDTDGKIVDDDFVTATSGTGTRGTFDFTTAPYPVNFDGVGALIVYEPSAKDGSRINLVEIPLRMMKTD